MRQLVTRINDQLHQQLKDRAARERRSVNTLVTEFLAKALASQDERSRLALRLSAEDRRVLPPVPRRVPSRDAAISSTRGAGTVASDALAAERASR